MTSESNVVGMVSHPEQEVKEMAESMRNVKCLHIRKNHGSLASDSGGFLPARLLKVRKSIYIQPELMMMLVDAWRIRVLQMKAQGEVPEAEIPSFSRMVDAALHAQVDALKEDNHVFAEEHPHWTLNDHSRLCLVDKGDR